MSRVLASGDRKFSVSLDRGLRILTAFSSNRHELGVTEVSEYLKVNKSTAHRYMSTLRKLGYLEQDDRTRMYRLGIRVIDLGLAALNKMELRAAASPVLEALSKKTGKTLNVAILDGTEIVYVLRARTENILELNLDIGSRLPAYCTSMGKVLLASLPQQELEARLSRIQLSARGPNTITTREKLLQELCTVGRVGYALNNEELAYGLRSAAAPIRRHDGIVVAAANIAVHAAAHSRKELEREYAPLIVRAARDISRRLGYAARGDDRRSINRA